MADSFVTITNILDVSECVKDIPVVIFDLDDTLYSEKEYVKSGFKYIARFFPDIENAGEELYGLFLQRKNAIDEFLRVHNIYSDELKEKLLHEYRFQVPDIHLYDGVYEMLRNLKRADHKLGMITDGRVEGQKNKIDALRLNDVFDKIIITDSLGGVEYRKPNPKAFELMKDFFNTSYSDMSYVGDNINKDFVAPDMLKIHAIWFDNPDGLYSRFVK